VGYPLVFVIGGACSSALSEGVNAIFTPCLERCTLQRIAFSNGARRAKKADRLEGENSSTIAAGACCTRSPPSSLPWSFCHVPKCRQRRSRSQRCFGTAHPVERPGPAASPLLIGCHGSDALTVETHPHPAGKESARDRPATRPRRI